MPTHISLWVFVRGDNRTDSAGTTSLYVDVSTSTDGSALSQKLEENVRRAIALTLTAADRLAVEITAKE